MGSSVLAQKGFGWSMIHQLIPPRKEFSKNLGFRVIASVREGSFQYEQKRDKQSGSEITLEFGFGGELGQEVLMESQWCWSAQSLLSNPHY